MGGLVYTPTAAEQELLFGMLSLVAQFEYWSRIVRGLNQEHA